MDNIDFGPFQEIMTNIFGQVVIFAVILLVAYLGTFFLLRAFKVPKAIARPLSSFVTLLAAYLAFKYGYLPGITGTL